MFNYDVKCMVCGKNKVYEVSFMAKLSDNDVESKKSGGVCAKCAPNYETAMKNKTKLFTSKGPFFILKAGE